MGKDYFVTFENYIEIRFQSDQVKVLGTQLALCLQGASDRLAVLPPAFEGLFSLCS